MDRVHQFGHRYRSPKDKLLVSLRRGHAERVVAMLGHHGGELHPNMSADSADNRLLHRAARFGHAGVVRALVGRGGDVKVTNKFGMTPLHHGAVHGGGEVIAALLEAGADPNTADASGRLPLHWTAAKVGPGSSLASLQPQCCRGTWRARGCCWRPGPAPWGQTTRASRRCTAAARRTPWPRRPRRGRRTPRRPGPSLTAPRPPWRGCCLSAVRM